MATPAPYLPAPPPGFAYVPTGPQPGMGYPSPQSLVYTPPPPPQVIHTGGGGGGGGGRVILYVGAAALLVLVGWGVYSFINGLGSGAALDACKANFQTAMSDYTAAFNAYIKANGGAALTAQQESTLAGYLATAQQATQCAMNIGTAQATAWSDAVVEVILGIAAIYGATVVVRNWLNSRAKPPTTASEAGQALRNGTTKALETSGDITANDASALNSQTSQTVQADAATEAADGSAAASTGLAEATAEADTALEANFIEWADIYAAEDVAVAEDAAYFALEF